MKKRSYLFLLSLILILATLTVGVSAASSSCLRYDIDDNEVTISGCDKAASGNLVIPAKIGKYPVTEIDDYAFFECYKLTSVVISDGIQRIGYSAFDFCSNLKSVYIPASVTEIEYEAFEDCDSLVRILFGGSESDWENIDYYGLDENVKIYYNHVHKYNKTITPATFDKDGLVKAVCMCGNYKTAKIYAANTVQLSPNEYVYNGKAATPKVTVKAKNGTTLVKDRDYKVTYSSGRVNPGSYAVKVTLMGNYSGSKTLKFTVYSKTSAIKLSSTAFSLGINQSYTLKTAVSPKTAKQAVRFYSSNTRKITRKFTRI